LRGDAKQNRLAELHDEIEIGLDLLGASALEDQL